ncbi:MAG TPA: hypothetical protein VFS62_08620 [Chloroflexota bacterium]|nr:hypothetical protein [Chloroflexota bacterium]
MLPVTKSMKVTVQDTHNRQMYRDRALRFRGELGELRHDLRELRSRASSLSPEAYRLRGEELRGRASVLTKELARLQQTSLWLQAQSLTTRVRCVEWRAQIAEREQLRLGLQVLSQGLVEPNRHS